MSAKTSKYVALLRGINVGGNKIIKMADLRTALSNAGLQRVQTYIQSGNVVFEYEAEKADYLQQLIKELILSTFTFDVQVMVKTAVFWRNMVTQNPYLATGVDEKQLLASVAGNDVELKAASDVFEIGKPDEAIIGYEVIYMNCVGKYHLTKLSNGYFEKSFGTSFTTRNWRTVLKIIAMLDE